VAAELWTWGLTFNLVVYAVASAFAIAGLVICLASLRPGALIRRKRTRQIGGPSRDSGGNGE
jgi:hypothetical protein